MRKLAIAAALVIRERRGLRTGRQDGLRPRREFRARSRPSRPRSAPAGTTRSARSGCIDEITQALTEKGWKSVDANADALVLLHGATEKQKSLDTFYSGGGYGGYGYRGMGRHDGMGTATTTTSEYLVGTLVVDIFDAKSKALMYRGTATDELSDKPEKNAKKLQKASDKLFKDFPPGSKEKK